MAINRRELLKRLAAFALLGGAGTIGFWELVKRQLDSYQQTTLILLPTTSTVSSTTSTGQASSQTSQQSTGTASQQSTSSAQSSSSSTASQSSASTTGAVPSGYILVAPMTALAGKTSAYFNHPNFGLSLLLEMSGQWKAFNAACTHSGCTVQFTGSSIYCPCHAGYFSPANGAVQSGPPPSSLPEYAVLVQNGSLYVGTSTIN